MKWDEREACLFEAFIVQEFNPAGISPWVYKLYSPIHCFFMSIELDWEFALWRGRGEISWGKFVESEREREEGRVCFVRRNEIGVGVGIGIGIEIMMAWYRMGWKQGVYEVQSIKSKYKSLRISL